MIDKRTTTAVGHGGVRLHVRDYGPAGAPAILFVHGWSQSHLSWKYQLDSDLAKDYRLVAFDLRGHGASEVPQSPEAYTQGSVWAADVAAVIESCSLERPVLVGWSLGSFIVCDYLRHVGDSGLAGVVLLSWAVRLGDEAEENPYLGQSYKSCFAGCISDDLAVNIEGVRNFVEACIPHPPSTADREEALCYNMIVPPFVRAAAGSHEPCDNADVLGSARVPLLAMQGLQDTIVLPGSIDLVTAANPKAQVSLYEHSAHAPFLDSAERFNGELREFAERAFGQQG